MDSFQSDQIIISPLKRIANPYGDILHIIQLGSPGTSVIQEVYASQVHQEVTKGWKRHLRLTLNIVVITGSIRFYFYDNRNFYDPRKSTIVCSPDSCHARLTIPPLVWVAFTGLSHHNMLINSISELHDPQEAENLPLDSFPLVGFNDICP